MSKVLTIEVMEYNHFFEKEELVEEAYWPIHNIQKIEILCECVVCGAVIDPQKVLTKPLIEPLVCERCRKKEVTYEQS